MPEAHPPPPISPLLNRRVSRAVTRHWRSVLAILLASLLASYVWTLTQERLYAADATGIITASTGQDGNIGMNLAADTFAKSKATQYRTLAENRSVRDDALRRASLAPGGSVTVSVPLDTPQIQVRVVRDDPREAAVLANAYIDALADAVNRIENQEDPGGTSRTTQALVRLIKFVPAEVPTTASYPRVELALASGLVVGLGLGLAFALYRSVADRRVWRGSTLEEQFGLSVLGAIPMSASASRTGLLVDDRHGPPETRFRVVEAFKELRTNLQFMRPDRPPRILAVTSPLPGDGKSTIATNLAVTLAEVGVAVTLVDGDLRRPTLAENFGLLADVGLTDVVVGRTEVEDVLQPVPEYANLRVLTAGHLPPNPSEILSSERLRSVLAELSKESLVIIDTPPLIPVTDAAIVAARFDGVLIVVQVGRTTVDHVAAALGSLARVKATVLGAVLNQVPASRSLSRAGYEHYYYYEPGQRRRTGARGGRAARRRERGDAHRA